LHALAELHVALAGKQYYSLSSLSNYPIEVLIFERHLAGTP
jgi:hypothetical protein